jgi:hypothetical protein
MMATSVRTSLAWLAGLAGLFSGPAQAALVARWTFDNLPAAAGIADAAGGFPARLENSSGKAGLSTLDERQVFQVPGSEPRDCLTLGEGAAFDLPKAFTLEAWFRPEPAPAGSYVMILGKRFSNQYQVTWTANGENTIEFYVGGGDLNRHRCWKDHLPTGRWLHVVAAYDSAVATGPNQWLYVNGELARDVRNEVILAPDQAPLRLAQNTILGLTGGVPAAWDEVAIYDHAFSAAEVATAYAAKAPRVASVAVSRWVLAGGAEGWQQTGGANAASATRDGMSGIVQHEGAATLGQASLTGRFSDLRFSLTGEPPRRVSAAWRRPLDPPLDGATIHVAKLVYRARGLQRAGTPLPTLRLESAEGSTTLFTSSHLILDGRSRTIVAATTVRGAVEALCVDLAAEGSAAEFAIERLELGAAAEPAPAPAQDAMPEGCTAVALPAGLTRALADIAAAALAGEGAAVHERWAQDGLPFQGLAAGTVLWAEDTATPQNEAEVDALGTRVKRGSFLPVGRDDLIGVDIGSTVSEVYLLLVTDLPAIQKQYSRPPIPCVVRDVEAFAVDLVYGDGTVDTTFPWSPSDGGYRVVGLAAGYVVPADPQRLLQRVVLHNRMLGRTIGLAAVTVNAGAPRFPQLAAEPPLPSAPVLAKAPETRNGVSIESGIVRVSAGVGVLVLDCRDGFFIRELRNLAAPGASFWPGAASGIEVRCGGRVLSGGDFRVTGLESTADTLSVGLASRVAAVPLELRLSFRAEGEAGIVAGLSAKNTGTAELRADLRFPCLSQLRAGPAEDTWVFFPQYRNVLTNREVFCKQANHRGFVVQFMDVFSAAAGGGLCLLTRNLAQEPVQYAMAKGLAGVSTYIESEGEDFPLAPGASQTFCDRVLALHAGDWHAGAEVYRGWVSTWYQPVHSQDKEWFRQAAWIRSHITSPAIAKQISRTPPIYDAASRRWRLDEFLAADRQLLGVDPDLVHFYVWAFDDTVAGDQARSGDYGGKDYDNLGGLESFRAALDDLRTMRHKPVSLYTIWDRYTPGTEFHRKAGDRFARLSITGQKQSDADLISISPGVPEWRAYAQQTLKRLQAETAADILYLDVFGTDDRARDLNPDAGLTHLPNWVADDDRRFLAALREVLPAATVLWGEFPVPDVASQYWDGFLSYDGIPLHDYMAEALDRPEEAEAWSEHSFPPNAVRYLFPHLRQVVFPVGTEGATSNWRYLKFLLFNGQALFDTTWRLYDERCREQLGRILQLETSYADCFDSVRPQMLVPTLRAQVFANCFPGKTQTAWTLFNGRYRTVRGEVLAVPHRRGALYRDAWNGRDLTPVQRDGQDVLSLDLPPQGIGMVVQAAE